MWRRDVVGDHYLNTVGYGDHYPVTARGRLVGVGLMLGGIALLGVVTATLASWSTSCQQKA